MVILKVTIAASIRRSIRRAATPPVRAARRPLMTATPETSRIVELAAGDGIAVAPARWSFAGDVAGKFDGLNIW